MFGILERSVKWLRKLWTTLKIDILVNNVHGEVVAPTVELTEAQWDREKLKGNR